MRTFHVTIRQAGRTLRFDALARCSVDAILQSMTLPAAGEPFSISVRG